MATYAFVILTSKGQLKNDGTAMIRLRITQQRKQRYVDTYLYTRPEHWDSSMSRVAKEHPNAKVTNTRLADIDLRYQRLLLDIDETYMTADDLAGLIRRKLNLSSSGKAQKKELISFSTYNRQLIKNCKKNTASWHQVALDAMLRDAGKDNIGFSEITSAFLTKLESTWRGRGMKDGGINNYMRALRSAWYSAELELNDDNGVGPVTGNPWRRYSLPEVDVQQSKGKALTADQVRALAALELDPKSRAGVTRNAMMLSFCTVGMSSVDMYNFTSFKDSSYSYMRTKLQVEGRAKRTIELAIEPEAATYMEQLKGKSSTLCLSERYADHKVMTTAMCKACKELGAAIGVPALTPQWMRHSWASIARNDLRISTDDIAFCLGHKLRDNRVTDIYLKDDHDLRRKINRAVLDYIAL